MKKVVYIGVDGFPLGEVSKLEPLDCDLSEEFDIPKLGGERSCEFEIKIKQSALNKIFRECFGVSPYQKLEKCAKCALREGCVREKIKNNFRRCRQ